VQRDRCSGTNDTEDAAPHQAKSLARTRQNLAILSKFERLAKSGQLEYSVWAQILNAPEKAQHVIGKLLKYVGEDTGAVLRARGRAGCDAVASARLQ
jgi:hypothetical protein